MSARILIKRVFQVLFAVLAVGLVAGLWIHDLYRVVFLAAVLSLLTPNGYAALREIGQQLQQRWTLKLTYSLLGLFSLMFLGAWIFHILGLRSSYIDFGHYVQLVHNYVFHGEPIYNFHISDTNYFKEHRSISIYFLYFLYGLFPSAETLGVYQAIGFVSPVWIFAWWARKKGLPDFQIFLCGFLYMFTLPFVRQLTWPYTAHILGFPLLSLAYVFFDLNRRWAWAICLVLLAGEKEDFGLIGFSFSLVGLLNGRSQKSWLIPSFMALCVSLWGLSFKSENRGFSQMFGHLGNTPGELIANVLKNPFLVVENYFYGPSLLNMAFFLFASGIWIYRGRYAVQLFFPVVPTILANCLGNHDTAIREIGSYFSLLVNLGSYSALILCLAAAEPKSRSSLRICGWLIFVVGAQFFFGGKSVPREFLNAVIDYHQSSEDRRMAQPFLGLDQESRTLCCEPEDCGGFSRRVRVYRLDYCLKRPELTDSTAHYLFNRTESRTIQEPTQGFKLLMQGTRFSIYQKEESPGSK